MPNFMAFVPRWGWFTGDGSGRSSKSSPTQGAVTKVTEGASDERESSSPSQGEVTQGEGIVPRCRGNPISRNSAVTSSSTRRRRSSDQFLVSSLMGLCPAMRGIPLAVRCCQNMCSTMNQSMALEELSELIETLRTRIAEHEPVLRQNETMTRTTLVDTLLRGLGWDTTDPHQVFVEYRTESGIVDYALLGRDGKPEAFVEAKKLGSSLRSAVAQAAGYCLSENFPRFAVTDGRHWELYEMSRPVHLPSGEFCCLT